MIPFNFEIHGCIYSSLNYSVNDCLHFLESDMIFLATFIEKVIDLKNPIFFFKQGTSNCFVKNFNQETKKTTNQYIILICRNLL